MRTYAATIGELTYNIQKQRKTGWPDKKTPQNIILPSTDFHFTEILYKHLQQEFAGHKGLKAAGNEQGVLLYSQVKRLYNYIEPNSLQTPLEAADQSNRWGVNASSLCGNK